MLAWLALATLLSLSGWAARRPRPRARKPTARASKPKATAQATAGTETLAKEASDPPPQASMAEPPAPPSPPVDHFRAMRPRAEAPPVAAIAARSLPLLGLVSVLVTLVLAVGAARGELPYLGVVDNTNPVWAMALVTISLWAVYLLWKVPQWQADAWAKTGGANPRELFEIENASRGTLGQILSGVAVLTGLIFAWQQLGHTSDNLRVSEEGQITDRFTRAVDQLGSEELTVRLGGIYALERIARDSPRDYAPVMEVLTAFARQESPLPGGAVATPAADAPPVPLDVRAALKVIGRPTPAQIEVEMIEGGCLDLTGINAVGVDLGDYNLRNTCWDRSDLRGALIARADLSDATFVGSTLSQANLDHAVAQRATFSQANLAMANLSQADLSDANLLAADLSGAAIQGTNLSGTNLIGANLQNAIVLGADLSGADLLDANLTGATLSGALLGSAEHLTAEQIEPALVDGATTLPDGIDVAPDF